ncbi:unnamed protein product [Aphanomyces euteiches]
MACHWWPLPILIIFVTGLGVGISYVTKSGVFAPKGASNSSSGSSKTIPPTVTTDKNGAAITLPPVCTLRTQYLKDNKTCTDCPGFKGGKTFSVFWESQADGCQEFAASDAAKYVTHVYWGFATIDPATGAVSQTLQGNDATLNACIKTFQNMCIKNYVSFGGASERNNFLQLTTSDKWTTFGKTAATLVQKFNFSGVDIDDESGNMASKDGDWLKNTGPQVVGYLSALRSALDDLPQGSSYKISWDEFPSSFDTGCSAPGLDYGRCFPQDALKYMDQVNNMLYNDNSTNLDGYLSNLPSTFGKKVGSDKLVIGGCVGKSGSGVCGSYGDAPTTTQLKNYATTGASNQGAMLWTASSDWRLNKGSNVILMGNAGNYGVKW